VSATFLPALAKDARKGHPADSEGKEERKGRVVRRVKLGGGPTSPDPHIGGVCSSLVSRSCDKGGIVDATTIGFAIINLPDVDRVCTEQTGAYPAVRFHTKE
jgi:hypothetical protein